MACHSYGWYDYGHYNDGRRQSFKPYLVCNTCKGRWAYMDKLHLTCPGCKRTFLDIAMAGNKQGTQGQASGNTAEPAGHAQSNGTTAAAATSASGPSKKQSPSELLGLVLSLLGSLEAHELSGDLKDKLSGCKEVAKAAVDAGKGPTSKEQWSDAASSPGPWPRAC